MPNMVGERSIYLDYTLNHVLIIVPAIKIISRQCVYRRILRLIDSVLSFPSVLFTRFTMERAMYKLCML